MFLFILPLIVLTSVGLFGLVYISQFTSPTTNEGTFVVINLIYFFVGLWLSLAGLISLMLYWVGNFRLKQKRTLEVTAVHKPKIIFKQSLRHGVLLASGTVGIGLLNVFNFANSLNVILIIIAIVLIEVYFFGH